MEHEGDYWNFEPALSKQRKWIVNKLLVENAVCDVLDLGTGDGSFFGYVRNSEEITSFVGVDIKKESLLKAAADSVPFAADYLFRKKEMKVKFYYGDISILDERFIGIQAVTCIEVIEHMTPSVLNQFRTTLFSGFRPSFIVITTPNKDFNIIWSMEQDQLRDPDHKFEFTRNQFQKWCIDSANQFYFNVSFHGVGDPPSSHIHLGKASQIAFFKRIDAFQQKKQYQRDDQIPTTPYQLIHESVLPSSNSNKI